MNFNLACYHSLLGETEQAIARCARACRLDATLKTAALDDPDLESVWAHIGAM